MRWISNTDRSAFCFWAAIVSGAVQLGASADGDEPTIHLDRRKLLPSRSRVLSGSLPSAPPPTPSPALLMAGDPALRIYGGVTTPTEADRGWLAAAYALLLAGLFYRALSLRALYGISSKAPRSSAAVGLVIGGPLIRTMLLPSEKTFPNIVVQFLVGLDVSPLTS